MVSAIQRFHCIKNKLLDTVVDSLKTASEKLVDETGELLGKRFAVAVTNSYDNKIVKTKPVEEVIVPPEKKEAIILNKLRQVL